MTTHIEHDGTPGRALAPECCVCRVGSSLFALIACCWLTALLLGVGPAPVPRTDPVLEGYRVALARAGHRDPGAGAGALRMDVAAAPAR